MSDTDDQQNAAGFDKLVRRLTDRLSPDPELQRDVARELRAHLEDCADEFRQAGQNEDEAAASAAQALGEPGELSEQLWQANRGRMRLRGVLRWTAGAALLPAAVVTLVLLACYLIWGTFPIGNLEDSWWKSHLTEEQAFVLFGDPNAHDPRAKDKSISDRWPDNPVYYGNYATWLMPGWYSNIDSDPNQMKGVLALLDKGERLDPENAYYNFAKAAWLVLASSTLADDHTRTYESMNAYGEVSRKTFDAITIHDANTFGKGLDELRRGLRKPNFALRSFDMLDLRMRLLQKPEKYREIVARIGLETSAMLPSLSDFRTLGKSISAYAISQVKTDGPAAIALARSVSLMADNMGKNSQCLIELLTATAIRSIGLAGAQLVARESGQDTLASTFQKELRAQEQYWVDLRAGPCMDPSELRHAGMLWSVLTPSISGYRVDFEPLRTTEWWMVTELGLLAMLGVLTLMALIMGAAGLLSWLLSRKARRPMLLFVGWSRIGRICLLSIFLPLAAYGVCLCLQIATKNAYGLNFTAGRIILEFVVVISLVSVLLLGLSYSAIRRRCAELGMDVPEPARLHKRWFVAGLASLLVLAVAGYEFHWWADSAAKVAGLWGWPWGQMFSDGGGWGRFPSPDGLILAGVVVASIIIWLLVEFGRLAIRRNLKLFRGTLYRSLMPILASSVIVVALACGWVLAKAESSAAGRVTGNAALGLSNDLERSDYGKLRAQFAEWQAQDRLK